MAKSKMNLPNKLTVMRMCLVPVCIAAILIPEAWLAPDVSAIIALVIFATASITDAIDGKLARKYNLITDFGKFMDPLADKFLVLGSFLAILYRYEHLKTWLFWAVLVVIFREFAVTSIRLVVSSSSGVVIAANWLGKVKTCVQIGFILAAIIEPMFEYDFLGGHAVSYVMMVAMTVMTVWSGVEYFKGYWKYINPSV